MSEEPHIEQRAEQPYIALPATVTMQTLGEAAQRHFPELFGWLERNGVTPVGAPFIRFLRIDMDAELEIELAVPVAAPVQIDPEMVADVLPGGRYVTLVHRGSFEGLIEANRRLQEWAQERDIHWRMSDGDRWDGRVERYLTDPAQEPDERHWETEVAYLARD